MDNIKLMDRGMIDRIIGFFDNINPIDIDNEKNWEIPKKGTNEKMTGVEYGDRISENIRVATENPEEYDVTYIKNIFRRIDKYLSKGIPFHVLQKGGGFAFPNVPYNNKLEGYNQLHTKLSCEDFINEVINFDPIPQGRERIKVFYLLGYVGSGKSTFINYILNYYSKNLNEKLIIQVHFEYDDIKEEIYNDRDQLYWDEKIWDMFLDKVKSIFQDPAFIKAYKIEEEDVQKKEDFIRKVIIRYNILAVFDGLDSLSPNKIEKNNNKYIVIAITKCLKKLKSLYCNHAIIKKQCHVIFSLRKCTYDMPDMPRVARIDENQAYFLPAPKFESIIEKISTFLLEEQLFLKENKEKIIAIIKLASRKLECIIFGNTDGYNAVDIFDNNYRRRLRYISSLIIVMALRASNIIPTTLKVSGPQIHTLFFEKLFEGISSTKDYIAQDILVCGVNTGFNNHFSDEEQDDNLGSLCGFIDNIFCYFPFGDALNYQGKMILKLRVLQILHIRRESNGEFKYLSLSQIKGELSSIGINFPDEEIKNTLDFLEKSLFVRSTKPYENKLKYSRKTRDELYFKCSNLGSILLKNIIFTYAYISGVAQNSCLPERLSEKIIYHKKTLSSHGNFFFINKEWVIEIIPTILLFLRVLKQVELNNPRAKDFYIHEAMIKSCSNVIKKILLARNPLLTENDGENLYNKCVDISIT